ncbi:hypothetical protein [Actinosynnema mirum]|uniref:Phage head-tail adaptor n=1 Tax=Actinosynnema mirum (strain ATCC 29888 / DSM 43827 / JCM 3225 / NBRC 14064 / NCIMB 13271 / NRRL B-12336 / IMRU 3971 / 101) TaxID=446462 RepID=C6W8R3_ACTMD|nr:hypothetical protein [Actinosynnema mirum]ACU37162.1 hypothetical protein Amir_3255 [Actinosynnema mirum DSM 43827]
MIITPVPVPDAYDNPTPTFDYGPDAARRVGWGRLTPVGSTESAEPGRRTIVSRLELVTFDHLTEHDHVEWKGRTYEVDGLSEYTPRFGLTSYQARLKHVRG